MGGAPHPVTGQVSPVVHGVFPPVNADQYCGEHPLFGISEPLDKRLTVAAEGHG